jgi:hypothetical protein
MLLCQVEGVEPPNKPLQQTAPRFPAPSGMTLGVFLRGAAAERRRWADREARVARGPSSRPGEAGAIERR